MGFFHIQQRKRKQTSGRVSKETLKSAGCSLCPLDKWETRLNTPKMRPQGAQKPLIYVLGSNPGGRGDKAGESLTGAYRRRMKRQLKGLFKSTRFSDLIRCAAVNREPTETELACCSGYLQTEIERTKPKVIIGLGKAPLEWAAGRKMNLSVWRGRMFPVCVGDHVCWYFCSLAMEQDSDRDLDTWERDMKKLVNFITNEYREPVIPSDNELRSDIITLDDFSLSGVVKIKKRLEDFSKEQTVGFDIETYPLRPYRKNGVEPVITSVAITGSEYTFSFPFQHEQGFRYSQQQRVYELLGQFILESGYKVCHNVEFELEWLAAYFGLSTVYHSSFDDTMAQAYILDERKGALSLESLTFLKYGFWLKDLEGVDTSDTRKVDISNLLLYNALDSKWTRELFFDLQEDLSDNLFDEYENRVEQSLSFVGAMLGGVYGDKKELYKLRKSFVRKIREVKGSLSESRSIKKFERKYKQEFNPFSSEHCLRLFKDLLGFEEELKTDRNKSGYSTDEKQMEKVSSKSKEARDILLMRSLDTTRSTFLDETIEGLIYDDGYFHTTYNNKRTTTGRSSSENPNLQNFPKRVYREVRRYIKPPKGFIMVPIDYGQIEARVVAMASKDEFLVKSLWTGYDIHEYWTQRLIELEYRFFKRVAKKLSLNPVTQEQKVFKGCRDEIKNGWVFPQFFGSSYKSCAVNLKIREKTASKMKDEFWDTFTGVKDWQEDLNRFYIKHGYVSNLSGTRYRRYPLTWNELINCPIQGTAYDIQIEAGKQLSFQSVVYGEDWM